MADLFSEILAAIRDEIPEELNGSQQLGLIQATAGDWATKESEKVLLSRLQRMLRQAKTADKRWRKRAEESWAFYDGDQWSTEDKKILDERKQAPVTINRVAPTIDLVIGLQVTQPMDWVAKPVGLQDDGVAEAASAALKHIAFHNNAFDVLIDSYKDALVYGIGWVHVGAHVRDADPESEEVQMTRRDPREIRVDPQSKSKDLADCRYVIWTRRVEARDAVRRYKKLKKKLSMAESLDDNDGSPIETYNGIVDLVPPPSEWEDLDWNDYDKEDIDPENQIVYLHELWERVTKPAIILEFRNGYKKKIYREDITMEDMDEILSDDVLQAYETLVPFVRYYVFSGTVLLESGASPYKHGKFPFVPVWHKRDRNGDPMSMVEQLKDPQKEINHRRSRLLWDLISNIYLIAPAALMQNKLSSIEEAEQKANRPDALWIGQQNDVQLLNKPSTASAQFQLMQDSKAEIQSVSGINDDLMGMDSSSRSGKAKQITMIQGATIQRPKEANLHLAHKLIGEIVLSLVQQFHTQEWVARITDDAGADVLIPLNQPEVDPETGQMRVLNNIVQARFDIAVQDSPWSPTQRDRAAEILSKLLESEQDPMMRQALQQAIVIVGEIPHKDRVLSILNKGQQAAQQNMMMQQQQQMAQQGPPPGAPVSSGGGDLQMPEMLDPAQFMGGLM